MSDVGSDTGIKVVITVSVIIAACVAAVVIAKLVDKCYDRKATSDYSDDLDENMRDLIRTRLSLVQRRKRELQKAKQTRVTKVFKDWASKVKERKKRREQELDGKRNDDDDVVITIDKAVSDKKQNGVPRTPRFPFFSGGSLAGGAQKSPTTTRRISNANMETPISISPAPKGRPVSSTTRAFPNVIVTGVDGNCSKVLPKTVLVEEDKSNADTTIKQNGIIT